MGVAVSVIIPVYKVEKFIQRCTESLFGQTLADVEFIFVDDASPDRSMVIVHKTVEKYPNVKDHVTILTHEHNRGLAAARNTGMAAARGEYIYHCDSDDWVEPDALEKLYKAAKEKDADIGYCDFYISFEKNERYMHNPAYSTADELLRKGFLRGKSKFNVWNKLVRASIYRDNGILFPEGHNMGEDMTMIMVAACSEKVAYVPEALYHYVKLNTGAYSNTTSPRHLEDIRFNMDRSIAFLQDKFGDALTTDIGIFKLASKLPFLITDDKSQYKIWREWYPESNIYAFNNPEASLRIKIIQWAASKNLFFIVKLHYRLIYKFVYGILYR